MFHAVGAGGDRVPRPDRQPDEYLLMLKKLARPYAGHVPLWIHAMQLCFYRWLQRETMGSHGLFLEPNPREAQKLSKPMVSHDLNRNSFNQKHFNS